MSGKVKTPSKTKKIASKEKEAVAVKKRRHTFFYQAEAGSVVSVAGCFNDWKPCDKMLKDKDGTGTFQCTVMLASGVYQYKFCVNDTWCIDPANPNFTPNDMGTLNSVLEIE
jgi:1,4-alpha-glucan branching enzyme